MDWNNDGSLDILSGCYWTREPIGADAAHLQVLLGRGGNDFAEATTLKATNGKPILNVPHKTNLKEGERKYDLRNICTHQFAADIDADGDLDIVVGNLNTEIFLHENKGSASTPVFDETGATLTTMVDNKTAPHLYDWDGDGDLDLLSGSGQGGVYLAMNVGDAKSPQWSKFETLILAADVGGRMSKVHVTDWNADGTPDVVVGCQAGLSGMVSVFLGVEPPTRTPR